MDTIDKDWLGEFQGTTGESHWITVRQQDDGRWQYHVDHRNQTVAHEADFLSKRMAKKSGIEAARQHRSQVAPFNDRRG